MTSFTSNYETIKTASPKDKSLDLAQGSGDMTTPNQDKIQSTFLQSVLSNKVVITSVLVVLATGVMAFSANPVATYAATADVSITGGIPVVTVVNNCGGNTQVVYTGRSTSGVATACDGLQCSDLVARTGNDNGAFFLGYKPFNIYSNNNFGGATIAEFMPHADGFDIDISRVQGFNYGVSMKDKKPDGWRLTCNDVNCNDAYWLCDDADGNPMFSPTTRFATREEMIITFCPQGEANTDYFHTTNRCNGVVQHKQAATTQGPYWCKVANPKVWQDLGGTCVFGDVYGGMCHAGMSQINTVDQCEQGGGGGDTPTPSSSCTPQGADMYYHPGQPDGKLPCCQGLREVRENNQFRCRSSCTPQGADMYYHPGQPDGKLPCCQGLHEVRENNQFRCKL